jgi:hypothetical protein
MLVGVTRTATSMPKMTIARGIGANTQSQYWLQSRISHVKRCIFEHTRSEALSTGTFYLVIWWRGWTDGDMQHRRCLIDDIDSMSNHLGWKCPADHHVDIRMLKRVLEFSRSSSINLTM